MNSLIRKIQEILESHADDQAAPKMKAYMKDQFEFLGIKKDLRSEISKAWNEGILASKPSTSEVLSLIEDLWMLPYREYQYISMELLNKCKKKLQIQDLPTVEGLILSKSWWDTVDFLAAHMVGHLLKNIENSSYIFDKWQQTENIWIRRTCILYQLYYRSHTDTQILEKQILLNAPSKEFFIRKAIGWALRQYAKHDPQWVWEFVHIHHHILPSLSIKEALKHLNQQ